MYLNNPAFVTGHPASDNLNGISDASERTPVTLGIANLEKWLTFARQETSSLYGVIVHSKPPATTWSNTYYQETMRIWASNFRQLTLPPSLPNNTDQLTIAGIYDKVRILGWVTTNDLVFTRSSVAPTTWENYGQSLQEESANEVTIGDDFFSASNAESKTRILLQAIIQANLEIPSGSEAGYFDSIDRIRQRH